MPDPPTLAVVSSASIRRTSTRSCNGGRCIHILLVISAMSQTRVRRNAPRAEREVGKEQAGARGQSKNRMPSSRTPGEALRQIAVELDDPVPERGGRDMCDRCARTM